MKSIGRSGQETEQEVQKVEKTEGKQKELMLRECQEAALNVLLQFDKICQEQHFRYYLAYGTLIGAIRHQGFIPWDDDLDVMMPRMDFDRFKAYMESHADQYKPLKLHTRANTKNYYFALSRLSDMSYKYVSLIPDEKEYDIGAFIDIYPWDNFGNTRADAEQLFKMSQRYQRMYSIYINPKNADDGPGKAIVRRALHIMLHIIKGNHYDQKADSELRSQILKRTSDSDKYFGHIVWMLGIKQFEKSQLQNLEIIRRPFEGHEVNIPAAYDYMLRASYGDYMELPPEEERTPYHSYKIFKREGE